jgi:hypothetical protein
MSKPKPISSRPTTMIPEAMLREARENRFE